MLDDQQAVLEALILLLDGGLLALDFLNLLSLALPRRLRGLTVPKHSLDATLLLLVVCLGPFPVTALVIVLV